MDCSFLKLLEALLRLYSNRKIRQREALQRCPLSSPVECSMYESYLLAEVANLSPAI